MTDADPEKPLWLMFSAPHHYISHIPFVKVAL